MRRITLLTATLISVFSLSACTQREVVKVDPLTQPIEKSEPTKPAEPILITVVPDAEVEDEDEDNNVEIDADIDYYGKEEATQPAPSSPNSGFETSTPSTWNPNEEWKGGGNGMPTTRRSGGDWSAGGTW